MKPAGLSPVVQHVAVGSTAKIHEESVPYGFLHCPNTTFQLLISWPGSCQNQSDREASAERIQQLDATKVFNDETVEELGQIK